MTDRMREEFEAWAESHWDGAQTSHVRDALPKGHSRYGEYVNLTLQCAWKAWQASRAALAVELPDPNKARDIAYYAADVADAIEDAGVRVKP